ncbi:ABC transporter permease [Tahibacter sp. BL]|uniref:Transport permease protein n=1 Tax=Tahibacter soli TaxID=2983605 RepID=A0A9X3YI08_9GAMM|nr:ABC transporter permease [Tahibacter soli]MDC8011959.1 ABC transporter permease [Tahibacter soli]
MNLTRVGAIVVRQFYLMRSSPTRVVPLFAWVAIDIVLWGFIARYLDGATKGGPNFVTSLLGAVLLWDFFTRIMHGLITAFLEDVWSRNFLNVFATPLTITEYVAGLVVTSVLTSLVGLVAMLALAGGVFGLPFATYGAAFVPFISILFLFGIALGIFASACVLRFGPAAEWLAWPLPALLSPFAAVFYPLSVLPSWMQWIAHAMPPAYAFENMRAIVAGNAASPGGLAIGLALAVGYIALAFAFFVRIHKSAVRSGLLARYSAESAG